MQIQSATKIEEGRYQIASKPCPDCNAVVTLEIDGSSLYLANQGASVQQVLPNQPADVRERFVSGYCADCWNKIFDFDDDEEDDE
jgi:hypothetical protein